MSTRGLVGIKLGDNRVLFVYNHSDSYPSWLGKRIYEQVRKIKTEQDAEDFKDDIASGRFTGYDDQFESDENFSGFDDSDYLFYEYVYIIDFRKRTWSAYEHEYKNKRYIPYFIHIPFEQEVAIFGDYMKPVKKMWRSDNKVVVFTLDGKIIGLVLAGTFEYVEQKIPFKSEEEASAWLL